MNRANNSGRLDRRHFLKSVAGLGGACLAAGLTTDSALGAARRFAALDATDHIGVQLYTVRDLMQQDFEGTLEKVAEIGYKEVEFAGYYDRTPEQVRQLLDRLGLKSPSSHVGIDLLRSDLDGQIESALTIGHKFLTIPALMEAFAGQMSPEKWHEYAKEFNTIGEAVKKKGLTLAYHNHHFEFVPAGEGKTGLDVLVSETDPELVSFELDLMWTTVAGVDPVALFDKYPGRFVMWHVKDLKEIEASQAAAKEGMAGFRTIMEHISPVGEGEIDFARIFAKAGQSGLLHYIVENDAPKDALADITASYTNLARMLAGK